MGSPALPGARRGVTHGIRTFRSYMQMSEAGLEYLNPSNRCRLLRMAGDVCKIEVEYGMLWAQHGSPLTPSPFARLRLRACAI